MSSKKNPLVSILQMRCPQCRQGRMFHSYTYDLKNVGNMHKQCDHCGKNFTPEPGFYFGATYVSYALTVAVSFFTFWAAFPFIGWGWDNVNTYLIVIGIVLFFLTPLLYRLSRSIWLFMFTSYKSDAIETYQKELKEGAHLHGSDVH